jgi:hypothetical protein
MPSFVPQPAGAYAKQILDRLLIDLSSNSSRLEGNTYSLLDTRRLIEFGEEAAGRDRLEAQMVIKNALGFIPAILASRRRRSLGTCGIPAVLPVEVPAGFGVLPREFCVKADNVIRPLQIQFLHECINQLRAKVVG